MSIRKITTDESGQTMTEFAIVLPVLVVFLFGVIQFGILFNNYMTLTDAVRAGAREAAVSRNDADPTGAATTAVRNSASDLNQTNLTVTVNSAWTAGTDAKSKAVISAITVSTFLKPPFIFSSLLQKAMFE